MPHVIRISEVLGVMLICERKLTKMRLMLSGYDGRMVIGLPTTRSWVRVPPKPVGSSKTVPHGLRVDDNGASVHSVVNEYLARDRDGNCT